MTGPQSTLLAAQGDGDDLQGYITRTAASRTAWIAAHQHRAPRFGDRLRGLFRGHAEVPDAPDDGEAPLTASRLLDLADISGPGDFTQAVAAYEQARAKAGPGPFAGSVLDRPAPEVAHEPYDPEPTMAVSPVELADDLAADEPHDPRPYAPEAISSLPWWPGDAPGWQAREPMRPSPVLILAADLAELPAFREAMAMRTRNQAAECLCGSEMAGQSWGERMMREGIHMLSVWDLWVVRMLSEMPPAAIEAEQGRAA
jgi:hypothetical protein